MEYKVNTVRHNLLEIDLNEMRGRNWFPKFVIEGIGKWTVVYERSGDPPPMIFSGEEAMDLTDEFRLPIIKRRTKKVKEGVPS